MSNKELASDLHKPIITKFEKRKVQSLYIDNIWDANIADMQFNETLIWVCSLGVCFWGIPLSYLKHGRIMLATSKYLVWKYPHICSFGNYIF